MASKPSSSSSFSSKHQTFIICLIILFASLLFLLLSSFRPTKSSSNVVVRKQHNVDWFIAIAKHYFKGSKVKVGLVNLDSHHHIALNRLTNHVETAVPVRFDRISRDRKWEDYFPEWIDEDETWKSPKCPEIPMPRLEDYRDINVIVAGVPCGTNRTAKQGIRDVFRLQVNLVVANLVVGRGWTDPDRAVRHRTVYVVFVGSCGPMVEIFRCDDLLMHRGDYWVYKPEMRRLKQKVLMPVGSCELAPAYALTGKEVWRNYIPQHHKERHAYVTILHTSEAYVCGAIALAHSIRQTKSTKDLVLLADHSITPISIQGLTAAGWKVMRIQRIRSPFAQKDSYNEWNYSKLRVWQLTQYQKLIFIDADLIVLHNIDSLFVYPQLSAAGNHGAVFNSGLMVVEPSPRVFEYLMRKSFEVESYNGGDQGFLNEVFTWWHRLPWRLNAMKIFAAAGSESHELPEEVFAIHFLGLKPWMCFDKEFDCNWEVNGTQVFASDSAHLRWWRVYDSMPKDLRAYCESVTSKGH